MKKISLILILHICIVYNNELNLYINSSTTIICSPQNSYNVNQYPISCGYSKCQILGSNYNPNEYFDLACNTINIYPQKSKYNIEDYNIKIQGQNLYAYMNLTINPIILDLTNYPGSLLIIDNITKIKKLKLQPGLQNCYPNYSSSLNIYLQI